ncbi:iron chelate uptake ABC transporter family permease subunit [Paeniclostridium sordellii]|uniref:iron chelate uptake ABC transporter family permease subunit n=1 Tax=Paraclostridium sordellii TaxID=1505 RepID=UPI0005E2B217|nr:iron chelate uptake ABC transporter family permease subunit [Paeniclostridium sordellii]MBW4864148.1 iron chelate uptake ABC transporter family permease subunit [Paeniclostridium sp.]MBW4873664.1 iron chelate uptake ABC transporter family permease subunit [Paeniclostridium sp.]MRZ29198.1 iron chelate uptake ABC transporter family permease subunit [Paeniclostridium sordellii]CEN92604.1 ABC transporter iron-family permease [[Clostridium] sordellii] [Paeniclostridium sordellii]CEN96677.1 ABC t
MQASVNINKKENLKLNLSKKLYIIGAMIAVFSALFLTIGVSFEHFEYAMDQRIPKLIAIVITGFCIAFSSIVFQTITNNNILTPSVLGLDSLYILVQTIIVFLVGVDNTLITNKSNNFLLSVVVMVIASFILYKKLFEKANNNIFFLLLVGMIFGTLFKSLSTFMQVVIDPNEYAALQNNLYASFGNVNTNILFIAGIIIIALVPFIYDDIKSLDVISLGKEHAINLGVNYDKVVKKMIIVVAILVSVSTALVGPITFLGLLVTNVTKQIFRTYKHSYLICASILISILTLVSGQFLVERVFTFTTTISVIINFIGGVYFIYLLLKESRV